MAMLVILYAWIGRDLAALLLLPITLLPAIFPSRVHVGLLGQGILTVMLLGMAALLARLLPGPQVPFHGVMGPLVPFLAIAAILLASHRLFLKDPVGGDRITVIHGFWCLVACGAQRASPAYILGCTIYLAMVGAWLRGQTKPWWLGRHRGWWVLILGLSGITAGGLAWVIPKAHARVLRWLINDTPQIGLHDGPMELGSLDGLDGSARVVARIFHFKGDPLLRGVAYQDYNHGRWLTRQTVLSRSMPTTGVGGSIEIHLEPTNTPRFLAPLQARNLSLNTDSALVDPFGIISPIYGTSAQIVRYESGPRDRFLPERVQPLDLALPESIRPKLTHLAVLWSGGASSPENKLASLVSRLQQEHPYSTSFQRPPRMDPLIAFLETPGAGGHCEYFASAMALLARAVGIPTRVIGGYRISEYNRIGGYHVVRERSAHAWIEAYLPEKGWVSVDATPSASLEVAGPAETPLIIAWLDAVMIRGATWLSWAVDHPFTVAAALSPVVLIIVLRELVSRWRAARSKKTPSILEQIDPPRRYVQRVLDAFAACGVPRGTSEPLEDFAARIEPLAQGKEAAILLRRYAAFLYGGVGEEASLQRDFERCPLPNSRMLVG